MPINIYNWICPPGSFSIPQSLPVKGSSWLTHSTIPLILGWVSLPPNFPVTQLFWLFQSGILSAQAAHLRQQYLLSSPSYSPAALLTWPGSRSCSLWTTPSVPNDVLPFVYKKPLPPYLRSVKSFLFYFFFPFNFCPSICFCYMLGYSCDEDSFPREHSLLRKIKLFLLQIHGVSGG